MLGGFNTNIRYQQRLYHVQTEDGGADSPSIVTLLYQGGAILFSKKRSYEDLLGSAAWLSDRNLDEVVAEFVAAL
jgi:hypothetical protein